jgi:hypothetical protein
MRHKLVALAAFAICTPTIAAPAYLRCQLTAMPQDFIIELTVDESTGNVVETNSFMGKTPFTEPAQYGAGSIRWSHVLKLFTTRRESYELDRTTLALRYAVEEHVPAPGKDDAQEYSGVCVVQQTPADRQI